MSDNQWWDKIKPFVEITGLILLAVYTFFTIKMYYVNRNAADAAKKSADAAESAAHTAATALSGSQESFEINQRPYVVADVPRYLMTPVNGLAFMNINFKNIGKTPAIGIRWETDLIPYSADKSAPEKIPARFVGFLQDNFDRLEHGLDFLSTDKYSNIARVDLAPQASTFTSAALRKPLSAPDLQSLRSIKVGGLSIYFMAVIRYTDAFNHSYETQVCVFNFSDPRVWHLCDAHNTIN